jgi:hypothetical protein
MLEDGTESRETSAMDISELFVKLKEAGGVNEAKAE